MKSKKGLKTTIRRKNIKQTWTQEKNGQNTFKTLKKHVRLLNDPPRSWTYQRMVEVKFKVLHNISHYDNNKFSFHMHMFIIFILSFNKLNSTIDSNMKFMVAYNQSLHFKIHCKSSKNNITIHFTIIWHYKKFTQWNEHRIHYRSLCFSTLLKSQIQITTKSHVLLKKIPKQHLKFVLYQNKICGFLPLIPPTLPILF